MLRLISALLFIIGLAAVGFGIWSYMGREEPAGMDAAPLPPPVERSVSAVPELPPVTMSEEFVGPESVGPARTTDDIVENLEDVPIAYEAPETARLEKTFQLPPPAEPPAELLGRLDAAIREALVGQEADVVLFRGFDTLHELPSMQDRFRVRPATVANYPMYRGVAQLVGMDALPVVGSLGEQVELMSAHWDEYDYLFAHEKAADRAGHDGDRPGKIAAIEAVDAVIPDLVSLGPDVLVVTGDHSAPTQLNAHSWHPVPTLLWGDKAGRDAVQRFGERACATGILGHLRTQDLMPLMLASAGRLEKYGA